MNKKRGGSTKKAESEFVVTLQYDRDTDQYKWAQNEDKGNPKRAGRTKKKE